MASRSKRGGGGIGDAGLESAGPEDAGPEDAGPEGGRLGGGGPGGGRVAATVVAVLSAAAVVLAVCDVGLLALRHGVQRDEAVRQSVLNAARQEALNLVSMDARTLDRDYERMLAGAVDPLRADLAGNRAAARAALARSKGVSTGTVTDAGLVELQGDKASAVVIVDAVQTNTVTRSSLSHRFRFQLDLARRSDRWLVSNLASVDICGSGSTAEPGCAGAATPKPTPAPSATKR
jgi:Mce-associated membrane protein